MREKIEPGAASVTERLRLLSAARARGMHGGIMAMPILPGLSDSQSQIESLVRDAADAGAQFVCFGGLTLRPGRQKDYYYGVVQRHWPELLAGYERAYGRGLPSGAPDARFTQKVTRRYAEALSKHGLSARIPRASFRGFVPVYGRGRAARTRRDRGRVGRKVD